MDFLVFLTVAVSSTAFSTTFFSVSLLDAVFFVTFFFGKADSD